MVWAEPCAVEPGSMPDVIVCHNIAGDRINLARVSGRDGRVLWDVTVSDGLRVMDLWSRLVGDLDGDGSNDAALLISRLPGSPQIFFSHTLFAVSLRTGKQLWSRELENGATPGELQFGDLDGDKRPDVIVPRRHHRRKNRHAENSRVRRARRQGSLEL